MLRFGRNIGAADARVRLGLALLVTGVVVVAGGWFLETRNPRTNHDDFLALCVLAIGAASIGAGIGIVRGRSAIEVLGFAAAAPAIGYFLAVVLFWGCIIFYGAWRMLLG